MNNKEIDEMLQGIDALISKIPDDLPVATAVPIYFGLFGGASIRLLAELVKRFPEPQDASK
jgi:hypothetical protein